MRASNNQGPSNRRALVIRTPKTWFPQSSETPVYLDVQAKSPSASMTATEFVENTRRVVSRWLRKLVALQGQAYCKRGAQKSVSPAERAQFQA